MIEATYISSPPYIGLCYGDLNMVSLGLHPWDFKLPVTATVRVAFGYRLVLTHRHKHLHMVYIHMYTSVSLCRSMLGN
jgi:hypothetical protein